MSLRILIIGVALLAVGCMDAGRWRRELDLAKAAELAGQFEDAAIHYRAALAIAEALPPEHPCVVESLDRLGGAYVALGRHAAAEPLFRRSAASLERILGPMHPTLANGLNSLGEVYRATGRSKEAEAAYKRAIAIWEATLGPEHPNTAIGLDGLGRTYHGAGRFADAEPLYRRVVAIREQAPGQQLLETLGNLEDLLRRMGRLDEAESVAARARSTAAAIR